MYKYDKGDLKNTVDEMVASLVDEAEYAGIDLSELSIDNFNEMLDAEFGDGGQIRTEKFGDIAVEFALDYGSFDSIPFLDAHWKCIELAVERVADYFKNR